MIAAGGASGPRVALQVRALAKRSAAYARCVALTSSCMLVRRWR